MTEHQAPCCGTKLLKREGTCRLPPGWGTDHPGGGRCRKHFGSSPNGIKAADRERTEDEGRRVLAGIGEHEPVTDPVDQLQYGRPPRSFPEAVGLLVCKQRRRQ